MARRALIVGIDNYDEIGDLQACVADATAMAAVLAYHKDGGDNEGEPNFHSRLLPGSMPDGRPITRASLRRCLEELFRSDGDLLFHFSGHGILTPAGGFLCTSDATLGDWGISMQEVTALAMQSPATNIIVVLDCCHSGDMANTVGLQGSGGNPIANVRENMTVIAASRANELAQEEGCHGAFTGALLDALEGGAADHCGNVTTPALYAYASRRFSGWDQRPIYKANTTDVFTIRQCQPLIERFNLRKLIQIFPSVDYRYGLDPEHEPEDHLGNVIGRVNEEKVAIARLLKVFRDVGLVRASNPASQLYWAARRSETVELTPRGREYWWLVNNKKV